MFGILKQPSGYVKLSPFSLIIFGLINTCLIFINSSLLKLSSSSKNEKSATKIDLELQFVELQSLLLLRYT